MLRQALVVLLFICSVGALAQTAAVRRDSVKAKIIAQRLRIAHADSARDTSAAVLSRIALSALVKPMEGRPFLEQAAALAEDAGDLPLAIRAREDLVAMHSASGAYRSALQESAHLARLVGLRNRADSIIRATAYHNVISAQQVVHAAEKQGLQLQVQYAREEAGANHSLTERWSWAACGMGIAWALTILGLFVSLHRQRMARNRFAKEVEALQSRLAELAKSMEGLAAQAREQAAPPELRAPPVAPSPVVEPAPEHATAVDPIVLGLFKRQAPERIAALDTARAAGDHEKVLRVLHSLRPQLDAIDPAGLGALCTGLRAMQPSDAGRDAGLDRLIAGMNALLARS
jgi:hypothetical protein